MRSSQLRMYGKERAEESLPWEWVADRLAAAPIYWLVTTRKDSSPHARPIHGVFADGRLLLNNGSWNHHHNWEVNPRVTVHVESGIDVVIVEGAGSYERDPEAIQRFLDAYNPKYGYAYSAKEMPYAFDVSLDDVLAWRSLGEKGEKGFAAVGKLTPD